MASILLSQQKLKTNYEYLTKLFAEKGIEWGIVSKLLCGNKTFLSELLRFGHREFCDSHVSNLKALKTLAPSVRTIYIKPPASRQITSVVKYADVSLNTSLRTIERLSAEALRQEKRHEIIIMIELGELREGILEKNIFKFYERAITFPNIDVVGIGSNWACLSGVLPTEERLRLLCSYKNRLENRYGRSIKYVSGGASVTIPLLLARQLPQDVNHFRVGETLFLGTDVYHDDILPDVEQNVFTLSAQIIELKEKPMAPIGEIGRNAEGIKPVVESSQIGRTSHRAIIDVGLLDVDLRHIKPRSPEIEIVGSSSDMIILDLNDNATALRVGDSIEFELKYMGILRLMGSKYISKVVIP